MLDYGILCTLKWSLTSGKCTGQAQGSNPATHLLSLSIERHSPTSCRWLCLHLSAKHNARLDHPSAFSLSQKYGDAVQLAHGSGHRKCLYAHIGSYLGVEVQLRGIGVMRSLPLERPLAMHLGQITCSMNVEELTLEATIRCTCPAKGPHEGA